MYFLQNKPFFSCQIFIQMMLLILDVFWNINMNLWSQK